MSAYTLRMVVIVLSVLSPRVLLKQNPATCTPPYQITIITMGRAKFAVLTSLLKKYFNI